jgi:hypothetical protein
VSGFLDGVEGYDRRGQRRPVEVRKVSPETAKRLQAEARKARFTGPVAIPCGPKCRKKCCRKESERRKQLQANTDAKPPRKKRIRPVSWDQAAISRSQVTNGAATEYMQGIKGAVPVNETWYRRNDLSAPEIPPKRRNARINTDSEPVYRSESPKD